MTHNEADNEAHDATDSQASAQGSARAGAPGVRVVDTDLAVVGAGPAGMAGAATALAGGLRVTLVDAGHELGGQYWRQPPAGSATTPGTDPSVYHHDLSTYESLRRYLHRHERIGSLRTLLEHHVWTATLEPTPAAAASEAGIASEDAQGHRSARVDPSRPILLEVVDRSGGPGHERAVRIRARRLLLATGAYERQLPFPGWTLPGVFTAGAFQALLKANGVRAGSRVVVAGSGPFLLPVAVGLLDAGARVVAVCEAAAALGWFRQLPALGGQPAKLVEGAGYAAALARHRVPVYTRTAVIAAKAAEGLAAHAVEGLAATSADGKRGADTQRELRLGSVTLARLDAQGAVLPGTGRDVEVDAVGVGWGFVPQLDLALTLEAELIDAGDATTVVAVDDDQRTSVPQVFAAGETCGIGGSDLALREGQIAAEGILADLGRAPATGAVRLAAIRRTQVARRRFAQAVTDTHPLPSRWTGWLEPDTLVCRCEEVDAATVRAAIADGALDGRQIKQLTRAGMGWCQGRMCALALECLAREEQPATGSSPAAGGGPAPRGTSKDAAASSAGMTGPAIERLVATPVPLGVLAQLDPAPAPAEGRTSM